MPTQIPNKMVHAAQVIAGILRVGPNPQVQGGAFNVQAVNGSPNGQLAGSPGDIAVRMDMPSLWIKTSGTHTVTGWEEFGTGGGSSAANAGTYGLRLVGISGQGAVDTSVLLFSSAPALGDFNVPTAEWLVQNNDADGGTTFQIVMEGTYHVGLGVSSNSSEPGDSPFVGISLDASGLVLTNPPLPTFPSVQAMTAEQDASLPSTLFCSAAIYVPQEEIDAGRGVIRMHATPGAALANTQVMTIIRRVNSAVIP